MAITINTPVIHKSYASVLSRIDPNALIFDNPNQQGTKLPAWFIVHREPVSSTCAIDGYQWLVYAIDIYYMVEYNKPRLFDEYAAIADQLDLELEYLPIYGTDTVVHVFDRSWELAMNALKYSTTLRLRVHPSVQREPYMQVVEDLEVFLKEAFPIITVRFVNLEHSDLNVELPQKMYIRTGQSITLPTITGYYSDSDGNMFEPVAWSLGNFGETIGPLSKSTFCDLIMRQVYLAWADSNKDPVHLTGSTDYILYDINVETIEYDSSKRYSITAAYRNDPEWPEYTQNELWEFSLRKKTVDDVDLLILHIDVRPQLGDFVSLKYSVI